MTYQIIPIAAFAWIATLHWSSGVDQAIDNEAGLKNPPAQPSVPLRPLDDPKLRQALEVLRSSRTDWSELMADEAGAVAQKYSTPTVRDAIQTTLEALENQRLYGEAPSIAYYGEEAIHAALLTGDPLHIPVLKKLAHVDDAGIRRACRGHASAIFSVNPPVEVFKEALLSAEQHLPAVLQETREFEDSLQEFVTCVERVADYGSKADRKEFLPPIIDRFLSRYSDPRVRSYWEPRLHHTLNFRSRIVHAANGDQTVDEPRDSDPPSTSPAAGTKSGPAVPHPMEATGAAQPAEATPVTRSRGLVAAIVIAVAASIGLIWHIVRRARSA